MIQRFLPIFALLFLSIAAPASAQQRETPYWATIRATKMNMRVGPSLEYKIDWVYRRAGLPVKVVRVVEGWRLIRDADGTQGWVVSRMLDASRGAVVVGEDVAAIRAEPSSNAKLKWNAQPGVVGRLGSCDAGWCEFNIAGRAGYVEADRLWGAGKP